MQGIPKRNTDKQMHIPITLIEYPHGEKDYFKKKKKETPNYCTSLVGYIRRIKSTAKHNLNITYEFIVTNNVGKTI